jgi:threonine dehydratase
VSAKTEKVRATIKMRNSAESQRAKRKRRWGKESFIAGEFETETEKNR